MARYSHEKRPASDLPDIGAVALRLGARVRPRWAFAALRVALWFGYRRTTERLLRVVRLEVVSTSGRVLSSSPLSNHFEVWTCH